MMSVDKHQILETITAVSRIITLAFKPNGTKIAIRDHKVVLCECENEIKSDGYFVMGVNIQKFSQGLDRFRFGDSRDDIYILNHVICNFIEWYVIPHKSDDRELYRGLINMAKYLCVSLQNLQKIYGHGNVVLTLQYYILVLNAVIDDIFYPEMLYMISGINDRNDRYNSQDEPQNLMYSTIFDIDKFKNFWSREELISLCSQFENCFRMDDEPDRIVFRDGDERKIPEVIKRDISINPGNPNINPNVNTNIYNNINPNSGPKDSSKDETQNSVDDNDNFVQFQPFDTLSQIDFDFLNLNYLPDPSPSLGPSIGSPTTHARAHANANAHVANAHVPNNTLTSTSTPVHAPIPAQAYHQSFNQSLNHGFTQRPMHHKRPKAVPKSQVNVVVQGHLAGITNILNSMDKKFTAMLAQSYKGMN
jgi:hypothetical protein